MKPKNQIIRWTALVALATLARFKKKLLPLFLLLLAASAAAVTGFSLNITGISVSGTNLTLKVTGNPGETFVLLGTTNLAKPWTAISTNTFGGYNVTNLVRTTNPAVRQQFYKVMTH